MLRYMTAILLTFYDSFSFATTHPHEERVLVKTCSPTLEYGVLSKTGIRIDIHHPDLRQLILNAVGAPLPTQDDVKLLEALTRLPRVGQLNFFRRLERWYSASEAAPDHVAPPPRTTEDLRVLLEITHPLVSYRAERSLRYRFDLIDFSTAQILTDGTFRWDTETDRTAAWKLRDDVEEAAHYLGISNYYEEYKPLRDHRDDPVEFDANEIQSIRRVLEAWSKTINHLYAGHNAIAREIIVDDQFSAMNFAGSLDELIAPRDYYTSDPHYRMWWIDSFQREQTKITSQTSRSPLAKLYGELATRRMFWPYPFRGAYDFEADLDHIRIAVNEVNNTPKSIEVIARDRGGEWQPFFYEKAGKRWLPSREFRGEPVKKACMRCHIGSDGNFSPLPFFIQSKEDLISIGFKDERLIERLLKFKSSP